MTDTAAALRREIVPLVAAALAVPIPYVLAGWLGGGTHPDGRGWTIAAVGLVGLLMLIAGVLRRIELGRAAAITVACALGFVAWTSMSLLWTPRGWDATIYAALQWGYLAMLVLGIAIGRSRAAAIWALTIAALAATISSYVQLASLHDGSSDYLMGTRLAGTLGYFNGEAALLAITLPAWLAISASRSIHPLVRALDLAAATAVVPVLIATQSRGAYVSIAVCLVVLVAVARQRLRILGPVTWIAVVAAVLWNRVLDATVAVAGGASGDPAFTTWTWGLVIAGFAITLARAYVDRRIELPRRLHQALGAAVLAGTATVLVIAIVVAAPGAGDWWSEQSDALRGASDPIPAASAQERIVTLGTTSGRARISMWDVSLEIWGDHPVIGAGTRAWETEYYQRRPRIYDRYVKQPHNVAVEVAAETGAIGVAWLAALVAGVGACAFIARRAGTPDESLLVAGLAAGASYWLVHGLLEWFLYLPAVSLLGALFAGMLIGRTPRREPASRATRLLAPVTLGVAAVVSLGVGALQLAAHYETKRGAEIFPHDQPKAVPHLQRATELNPWETESLRELLRHGALGVHVADIFTPEYVDELTAELAAQDGDHYDVWLTIGRAWLLLGDDERAREAYDRAAELNPLEAQIAKWPRP